MSCCNGNSRSNGAVSKRYNNGCNCSSGSGSCSGSGGCCNVEETYHSYVPLPNVPQKFVKQLGKGGCGRPNCARMIPPPSPASDEEEWEFPNGMTTLPHAHCTWHGNNCDYLKHVDNSNRSYTRTQPTYDEMGYSDNDNDMNQQNDYEYQQEQETYQIREGGGCDQPQMYNRDYADYYYEDISVDEQKPLRTRPDQNWKGDLKGKYASEIHNKKVHF
ncbi:uncharacterized protein LOC105696012 [Orussus abietinus]|uniref:uncharacterized protein LOC105696012 n=1 Tax=Orussus abietinus TaxID=222816 RepID=UPI0006268053|nr:uncharacterized protein LOC105696012 [Orussus abietinus]